jgi:hypothetical protein
MNKTLKRILIGLAVIVGLLFIAYQYLAATTKKASPEATATFTNGVNITVKYCKPSKKGREIFGGLVPFGEVWRTGANEATVFTTDKDLNIGGKTLKAGSYSLWTIPNKDTWEVIFNSEVPSWGVSFGGKASRDVEKDVIQVSVPVENTNETQEMFDISFTETPAMVLAWDKTKISVPIVVAQ